MIFYHPRDGDLPRDGDCSRDGNHNRYDDHLMDCSHHKNFYHPTGWLLS